MNILKIPKNKHQIPNKLQYPNSKPVPDRLRNSKRLGFEIWNLFVIWNLELGFLLISFGSYCEKPEHKEE
ncbi:hypothetical protein H8E88_33525 [candidate division KSB1 bacterium]|nr:hypothetical protein [candidate division KSB1 bacterium]